MKNFSNILIKYILPVLCLVIGIVVICVASSNLKKIDTYPTTTATITHIEVEHIGDDTHHTVYVKYEVDGIEYENTLGEYIAGYAKGKEVTISYNPDNPEKILSSNKFSVIMMYVVGTIFVIVSVLLIIKSVQMIIKSKEESYEN